MVVLGGQVALHNSLIGTIFLQSIKDAVEDHHPECRFDEVPIIGSHVNLASAPCRSYYLARSVRRAYTEE